MKNGKEDLSTREADRAAYLGCIDMKTAAWFCWRYEIICGTDTEVRAEGGIDVCVSVNLDRKFRKTEQNVKCLVWYLPVIASSSLFYHGAFSPTSCLNISRLCPQIKDCKITESECREVKHQHFQHLIFFILNSLIMLYIQKILLTRKQLFFCSIIKLLASHCMIFIVILILELIIIH